MKTTQVKLPKARVMRIANSRHTDKFAVTFYEDTVPTGLLCAIIPLRTRPSRARLKAVQRLLEMSEEELRIHNCLPGSLRALGLIDGKGKGGK